MNMSTVVEDSFFLEIEKIAGVKGLGLGIKPLVSKRQQLSKGMGVTTEGIGIQGLIKRLESAKNVSSGSGMDLTQLAKGQRGIGEFMGEGLGRMMGGGASLTDVSRKSGKRMAQEMGEQKGKRAIETALRHAKPQIEGAAPAYIAQLAKYLPKKYRSQAQAALGEVAEGLGRSAEKQVKSLATMAGKKSRKKISGDLAAASDITKGMMSGKIVVDTSPLKTVMRQRGIPVPNNKVEEDALKAYVLRHELAERSIGMHHGAKGQFASHVSPKILLDDLNFISAVPAAQGGDYLRKMHVPFRKMTHELSWLRDVTQRALQKKGTNPQEINRILGLLDPKSGKMYTARIPAYVKRAVLREAKLNPSKLPSPAEMQMSRPKKGGGFEYGNENLKETGSPSFLQQLAGGGKVRDEQIRGTIERTGKSMGPIAERGADALAKWVKGRFG